MQKKASTVDSRPESSLILLLLIFVFLSVDFKNRRRRGNHDE